MILSTTLRGLRESNNYSQKFVASRLRCSPSIISSYETGERTPSLQNSVSLADLYRVSVDYLLGREHSKTELDVNGLSEKQVDALKVIVHSMKDNAHLIT